MDFPVIKRLVPTLQDKVGFSNYRNFYTIKKEGFSVNDSSNLTYQKLIAFFLPLGLSASLTSITHMIINGTLSRGENAAFIIACYAVALSLFGIVERPIIVFRQTSSALVRDIRSFKLVSIFMMYAMGFIVSFSLLLAYSPFGEWTYIHLFNADQNMIETITMTFQVLLLVIIFSGVRGLYQGIIINHLETQWLTIMVVIRLAIMFLAAYLFVAFDFINSMTGAMIFLVGMIIECVISVWKGHGILYRYYQKKIEDYNLEKSEISKFYLPLVFYFVIQTVMIPVIYVFLAKTDDIEMGIASFALANAITQMILSFFMYTHQLVLQLYDKNKQKVIRFMVFASLLPTILLTLLCYTSVGEWFMQVVMGADQELSVATLSVLKFFIIKTFVFPWVDFLAGFLMLQRETRRMMLAQIANLLTVIIVMAGLIQFFPQLNGVNGAIAASLGEMIGLVVVGIIVKKVATVNRSRISRNF